LLGGVTIVFYPLAALALDQETKAQNIGLKRAIYVDNLSTSEAHELKERLRNFENYPSRHPLILMTTIGSLQLLQSEIEVLISKRLLRLVAIDEAHAVPRDGMTCRLEFQLLKTVLLGKLKTTKILATSASFDLSIYTGFQSMTGVTFDRVLWGAMGRRRIFFKVEFESDQSHKAKLFDTVEKRLETHPTTKVILYTPSAARAESTLKEAAYDVLDRVGMAGKYSIRTVVGDEGIMMKYDVMEAFSKSLDEPHPSGKVQMVIGTEAIDCGISSNRCRTAARDGPPASLVQIVQQMGRVARCHLPDEVNDLYCVVLSVQSFIQMVSRILDNESAEQPASASQQQLNDLFAALRFLALNKNCYHATLESHFSCPDIIAEQTFVVADARCSDPRPSCGNSCSICSGERAHFFPKVNKTALVQTLEQAFADVSSARPQKMKDLCIYLNQKARRKKIGTSSARETNGLLLQLIAAKIVQFHVISDASNDKREIGWKLGRVENDTSATGDDFVYRLDQSWDGIACRN
jgi:superfamily II DNA helicase RecQ